ncbi:DUF1800 domain-containing protein [Amnibacterium kyonggiense]|uniref:Uncharacterized protein (DUF1800 family) n=1 Tax=Amnibacterium kyonggiense TaxID=595671 RepID=A0A4R7FEE6_9MICO|nr:DUF1800 domain-containing protein [Amnibacterium kyonggiense]TDS75699.1 uncharacterized protein (DUF1800 family) [Amnibacterium kyonggiense]
MTDTEADITDAPRMSSRRGLFGIGAVLAAGAVAGEALVGEADAAEAATAAKKAFTGKQYPTASAAAKAAGRAHSNLFPHDPQAHLLRRATFGPRPKDVADLQRLGIDGWLHRQLNPSTIKDTRGNQAAALFPLEGARPGTILKRTKRYSWDAMLATAQATLARQIFSDRQLYEIVVDVFANRLHVPLPGEQWHTSPSFIKDVIRKHAFGSYEGMLLAAMKHPAMLNFLSNDESQRSNVNENLGRELLELHTVGRTAGYTEPMVRASAKILSGRTIDSDTGQYYFRAPWHWTGTVKVLGFSSANRSIYKGEAVGDAYLKYLAHHPATARNVARALAVRFVSDNPSTSLVNRLARVYLHHGTSIRAVVDAIFKSSDFWAAVGVRMRRPLEDAVGTLRVLDVKRAAGMQQPIGWLYWNLNDAGHTPYGWGPPNGYPDVAAAWLGAGAMLQRWNLHRAFVNGWWPKLGWTKPTRLVKRTSGMNTYQWTKAVARRVLGVTPSKAHLLAAIHGAKLSAPAPAPTDDWRAGKVVSLLLDSPYFQLR